MSIKAGKITWHYDKNPPGNGEDWSEPIYLGRPNPPMIGHTLSARNAWRDGTQERRPDLDGSIKEAMRPWTEELQAKLVAGLEQRSNVTIRGVPAKVSESRDDGKRAQDSEKTDESGTRITELDRNDTSPFSAASDEYWELYNVSHP